MRVAILGVGSIGGVFLSSLSNADVDLLAISRGPTAQSLISEGLIIHTPEGAIEVIPRKDSKCMTANQDQCQRISSAVAISQLFVASHIPHRFYHRLSEIFSLSGVSP